MKKIISLLIFIILLGQSSYTQIPIDKQKHFAAGAFIAMAGNLIGYGISEDPKKAKFIGIALGTLAAVVKEGIDEKNNKGWDNEDLVYNIAGSVAVTIPLYAWEKSDKKLKARKQADKEYEESLLKLKTIEEEMNDKMKETHDKR